MILTLPLTVLTLGLFLLVINAAMLSLVAWLLDGFSLSSFGTAIISSILISFFSWLGSAFIGRPAATNSWWCARTKPENLFAMPRDAGGISGLAVIRSWPAPSVLRPKPGCRVRCAAV